MSKSIAELRHEYALGALSESDVDPDPIKQFERWLREAMKAQLPEPNAMTLATADRTGRPYARVVLLKDCDADGFVFFTNYQSDKGRQLADNPRAALVFLWLELEKVRRWVREYGHSAVEEGSQGDAILDIYAKYGVVPGEIYTGVLFADGRHDHAVLMDELKSWLKWAEDNGVWDEARVVEGARAILDEHLGRPPETFSWQGRTFSPRSFLLEALRLDPGAYVSCVSRMEQPGVAFFQPCLLDVRDNWRRKADYLNLPLDVFRATAEKALRAGYTVAFGGDNSEPGVDGMADAAIVPRWDIPGELIDQGSREFRIASGQTEDDHGVHAVGLTTLGGRDWFLIKDSNRSSRLGAYEGYYMFDADYVALKMLTVMVHRDQLQGVGPAAP